MKKFKRAAFTLIEMMISLSLLAIIMSTFFFWYRHVTLEKSEMAKIHPTLLEESYLDLRLDKILSKAKKEIFFTKNDDSELVFLFDHGVDRDPLLSGYILGSLFLDQESRTLCFSIWPHPKSCQKSPCETQILLSNVSNLSFSFYYPPNVLCDVRPEEVGETYPKMGWQPSWKKQYDRLPPMMKVLLERGSKREEYVYTIEEGRMPILQRRSL